MTQQHKRVIVNEITFWKQNKLLPEHYCDFLIALYTKGEKEETEKKTKALLAKEKRNQQIGYLFLGMITSALFAALLLITSLAILPILLAGVGIIAFLYIAIKLGNYKSTTTTVLLVCAALLMLTVSFKVWNVYFVQYPTVLIGLIISNCFVWLFIGRSFKLIYFSISGIGGTLIVLVYVFKFYF